MKHIIFVTTVFITTLITEILTARCPCSTGEWGREDSPCKPSSCVACSSTCTTCSHWNYCTGCKPATFKSGTICIACTDNCLDCTNQIQCNTCAATYKLNPDGTKCFKDCGLSKYLETLSDTAACLTCQDPNAKFCEDVTSITLACKDGYSLDNDPSKPGGVFCRINCPDKKGWMSNNTCQPCLDPNCETCEDNTLICESCDDTYWLNVILVNGTPSNFCQKRCYQSDFAYTFDGNICKQCLDSCLRCQNNTFYCDECENNYFVNSTFNCQKKCPESRYYWNDQENDCNLCPDLCVTCQNRTAHCKTCETAGWLNETAWRCQRKCDTQHWFNTPNDCAQCEDNCEYCSNFTSNCGYCAPGYIIPDKDTTKCMKPEEELKVVESYLASDQENYYIVFNTPIDEEIDLTSVLSNILYFRNTSIIVKEESKGSPGGSSSSSLSERLLQIQTTFASSWEEKEVTNLMYKPLLHEQADQDPLYSIKSMALSESKMALHLTFNLPEITPPLYLVIVDQRNRVLKGAPSGQYGNSEDYSNFVYPSREVQFVEFSKYTVDDDIPSLLISTLTFLCFIGALILGIVQKHPEVYKLIQTIQFLNILPLVKIKLPSNIVSFYTLFGWLTPSQRLNELIRSSPASQGCQPGFKFYELGFGCNFTDNCLFSLCFTLIYFGLYLKLFKNKVTKRSQINIGEKIKPKADKNIDNDSDLDLTKEEISTYNFSILYKIIIIIETPLFLGMTLGLYNFKAFSLLTGLTLGLSLFTVLGFARFYLLFIQKIKSKSPKKKSKIPSQNQDKNQSTFKETKEQAQKRKAIETQSFLLCTGYGDVIVSQKISKTILPVGVKLVLMKCYPLLKLLSPLILVIPLVTSSSEKKGQLGPYISVQVFFIVYKYFFTVYSSKYESKKIFYIESYQFILFISAYFLSFWEDISVDPFMLHWIVGMLWLMLLFGIGISWFLIMLQVPLAKVKERMERKRKSKFGEDEEEESYRMQKERTQNNILDSSEIKKKKKMKRRAGSLKNKTKGSVLEEETDPKEMNDSIFDSLNKEETEN